MNNKQKQFILLTTALFVVIVLFINLHAYLDTSRFITGASRTSQALNTNRLRRPNLSKSSEHRRYPDLRKQSGLRLIAISGMKRVYVLSGQRVIYIMHARVAINHQSVVSRGQRGQQIDHVAAGHTLAGRNWSALSRQSYIVAPAASDQNQVKGNWLKTSFDFPNTIQLSRPDAQWLQTLPKGTKIVIR